MNKIKILNDKLEKINLCKCINVEYITSEYIFGINVVKIHVSNDTELEIEIDLKEDVRLNFDITIDKNVKFNLFILTKGNKGKIQYKYNLYENTVCNIEKFQNINTIKEMMITNLNGENATINYNFKTISNNKENYDFHIFHNSKNTFSNIKNGGVCIKDGSITFQVSSFVPKNITNCVVNQSNRIINLTNNESKIKPNLYIDCNDVEASHSALIGTFSDSELFYLQSRGITKEDAIKLLIRGFVTSDITNLKLQKNINKNLDKYWR